MNGPPVPPFPAPPGGAPAGGRVDLSKLILGLTYRCQARCVHCSAALHPVSRREELSLAELRGLLREASLLGVEGVNLFGGEPTLRSDFLDVLDLASSLIPRVTVDTNGLLFSKGLAAAMRSRGVETLFVSLAGASAAAHDAFQRVASFPAAVSAIETAVKARLDTRVSVCAFRPHVVNGEVERIIALARSLGASGVRIALPMCSGNWLGAPGEVLSPEEAATVRALAGDGFVTLVEEDDGSFERCHAVTGGSVYVSPYGDVQPCNFIPIRFGTIRREPLELILDRMVGHPMFSGDFFSGSCPMQRPGFVDAVRDDLDPASGLAEPPDAPSLFVGGACNNRCAGCEHLAGAAGTGEAATAGASRTAAPAGTAGPPRPLRSLAAALEEGGTRVAIRGGEPTVHPEILDLVSAARARAAEVRMRTNARLFFYPAAARRFRAAGLSRATVALFGESDAAADATTRAPGSGEQARAGIANLVAAGVEVEVELPPGLSRGSEDRLAAELAATGALRVVAGRESVPECGRLAGTGPARDGESRPRVLHSRAWRETPDRTAAEVLLVFPATESVDEKAQLPWSLLFLAAPLVAAGFHVRILDQRVTPDWREELEELAVRSPGLLCAGISCFLGPQIRPALEVAAHLKSRWPALPVAWGGAFPSLLVEETLRSGLADYVVRGEGEETFLELVRALGEGRAPGPLAGLSALSEGSVVHGPERGHVDLDALPPIPYELVSLRRYAAYRSGIQWALYTSRGCPHGCRFCAISLLASRRWRAMAAARVLAEVRRLHDLGARDVAFCEDNFFVDRRRVRAIAEGLVEMGLPLTWSASCRVDGILALTPDDLALLHSSGLRHLHVGAESGSDRILKLLGKKIGREHVLAANRVCRDAGIVPEYIFMTGFPTETEGERGETLSLIERLREENPEAWFWRLNHYVPYPGTPLFEEAVASGFVPPASLADWADLGWHRSPFSDLIDYQVGF